MDQAQARQAVIGAGKQLVEKGLIARTWGNVSCRVSDAEFLITPKGRAYETLAPEEIVKVRIADCSYEGRLEPSSESGVHAEVYRQRPEVGFVIHTHQPLASAVSPLGLDLAVADIDPEKEGVLGDKVVWIPYGLPGSSELRQNVASFLDEDGCKAYLMASHGALCLGNNSEKVFQVAEALEQLCLKFVLSRCPGIDGADGEDSLEASALNAARKSFLHNRQRKASSSGEAPEGGVFRKEGGAGFSSPQKYFYASERNGDRIRVYLWQGEKNTFASEREGYSSFSFYDPKKSCQCKVLDFPLSEAAPGEGTDRPGAAEKKEENLGKTLSKAGSDRADSEGAGYENLDEALQVHRAIYEKHRGINAVYHAYSPDIIAVSRAGETLYPLLDDFAQIIGPSVPVAFFEPDSRHMALEVADKMKGRGAVLLAGSGALCCGPELNDARAAAMILDKNCKAVITAELFGGVAPIDPADCAFMRRIYLESYSRKAYQK